MQSRVYAYCRSGHLNVLELPSGRMHRIEDPQNGELIIPDTAWLERGLADGSLRLYADDRGVIAPARRMAKVYDRDLILDLDPYAEARLEVMLTLIERGIEASDPQLGPEVRRAWTKELEDKHGSCPETATVRGWFGRCNGATVTLSDMLSMSGKVPRANRLDPAVEAIVDEARSRFWKNRGWKIVDVQAEVSAVILAENVRRAASSEPTLDVPGKETIRRRVNELLCRDTYADKYGEQAARRKFDGSGRGITAYRILQIGLMDDTVVDLVTVLDVDRGLVAGRPYLNVLMDVHSRCIVGLTISFQPPTVDKASESLRIAMNCVREGNRPKIGLKPEWLARYPALAAINGKFAKIITDNGFNYVAPAFSEMMLDLGIVHELAPVKAPRHKAMIERFFRSLNTYLVDKLPGATLDPSVLRKFGIDPASEAIVTMSELRELVDHFLYIYHISHHSGIDAVPLQKWAASMAAHGRDMILDTRQIDIVTGVTVHKKRVTAGGGLRMFGMVWKGPGLDQAIAKLAAKEPHRTRLDATVAATTKVKYNPENLLATHVFVGDDWVELLNTQPEYAEGLSLWQHRQIRAWSKRESLKFTSEADRLSARHSLNLAIRQALAQLAFACRLPVQALEERRYRPDSIMPSLPGVRFHGATIPTYDLALRRRRLTPAWARAGYHCALGHHGLATHCPQSGELLIDACPGCGTSLTWTRSVFHGCHACGYDLRHHNAQIVPRRALLATAPMLDVIHPDPARHKAAMKRLHHSLRNLDRGVVFEIGWRMGCVQTGNGLHARDKAKALPVEKRLEVLAQGSEALTVWPRSVTDALQGIVQGGTNSSSKISSDARRITTVSNAWPALKEAFRAAAPGLEKGPLWAVKSSLDKGINSRELEGVLGVSQGLVERLRGREIKAVLGSSQINSRRIFEGAGLGELRTVLKDRMELGAIVENMGFSRHAVEQLACLEQIEVFDAGPVRTAYLRRQARKSDFDNFLQMLMKARVGIDPEDAVSIHRSMMTIGGREKPWGPTLLAMISGQLAFDITGARGRILDSVVIRQCDIAAIGSMHFDRADYPAFAFEDGLTARDAERLLNINPKTASRAKKEHILSTGADGLLDRQEVLRLARQHMSGSEILARWAGSCRRLPTPFTGPGRLVRTCCLGWDRQDAELAMTQLVDG